MTKMENWNERMTADAERSALASGLCPYCGCQVSYPRTHYHCQQKENQFRQQEERESAAAAERRARCYRKGVS